MFVVENKASHNHLAIVQGLDICVISSFSSAGFKKNLNIHFFCQFFITIAIATSIKKHIIEH